MNEVLNDFVSLPFSYPVNKRLIWRTDIVVLDTAKEQRNQVWSQPLRQWVLIWDIMNETVRNELVELYQRAKGMYNTFLFRDVKDEDGLYSDTQIEYTVNAVDSDDATAKTFKITDDIAPLFPDGLTFEITAGNNDGVFTVNGNATSNGTTTTIIVNESVAVEGSVRILLIQDFQLDHDYYLGENETWVEDRKDIQNFAITNVSVGSETFTIAGRHLNQFAATTKFIVQGSTGNDANWVVSSVVRNGPNTVITVTGNITDATVDGTIIILYVESNSVAQVPTTEYTVDVTTGVITFTENQSPADTHVVTAIYKFNYRVRFDVDNYSDLNFSYEKWLIEELIIIEVKP